MYSLFSVFFFIASFTTDIYTLSLHDALPISSMIPLASSSAFAAAATRRDDSSNSAGSMFQAELEESSRRVAADRKSTRLNSSHEWISYAGFCLKKKNKKLKQKCYRSVL